MIGISDEPVATLRTALVEKHGAKFWLAQSTLDEWITSFVNVDAQGTPIPRYVLVDVDGIVVGHDMPTRERLEELLAEVFDPTLRDDLHPALADARSAYEAGAVGAAQTIAGQHAADDDAELAASARGLADKIAAFAAWRQKRLERELAQADPITAYGTALVARREFDGTALASWLDGRLRELGAHPDVAKASKVWSRLDEALARELAAWRATAKKRTYELGRAAQLYDKLADDGKRAGPGSIAKQRAAALRAKG